VSCYLLYLTTSSIHFKELQDTIQINIELMIESQNQTVLYVVGIQVGTMGDLNRAAEAIGETVKTTPSNHPDRAIRLNSLRACLERRIERARAMDDLNRAVDEAVKTTPSNRLNRASPLTNLGVCLGRRFERAGAMDLNHAVEVTDEAVKITPSGHPDRAACLNNLGICLGEQFKQTRAMNGAAEAIDEADHTIRSS
jgi:hypothetical protein